MPVMLSGNSNAKRTDFKGDLQYPYPMELDLHPKSALSRKLRDKILERANASATTMSSRHKSWNEIDKFLTTYKRPDEDEKDVLADDDRKPISIVFPYSYAILETLMSYMVAAFFRDPIFRFEGYSPEDVMGAILLEQVVNLHVNKFKVPLNLHTMFRDAFSYGVSPVAPTWKVYPNGNFQGNALINIDPYLYLPDPNVSANNVQDGEFVGWVNKTNYVNLLSEEYDNPDMFNVKYIDQIKDKRTGVLHGDLSNRTLKTGVDQTDTSDVYTGVDEINMYIKIIPSEWELGPGEYPEKWYFRLAADEVIITARPADFDHGKFPVATCAPDFDGYSATPVSRLEILSGLQGVLDWLFNSHIANVRKAINDMIIYDPYLVNSADLKDPKPGKLIRMRRPAWGKGVKDAVQQLAVNDITRANVADSGWIIDSMQKVGGTDDATMGSLRQGGPERLTKAEFQGTASGAVSRLERIARVIGIQTIQDIGEFFADHTIQVLDEETFIKITGSWSEVLLTEYGQDVSRGRMRVSPNQLDVRYDVVVRDGSIPGGNYSEVWLRMFDILAANPELAQNFDVVRIFKHIARNAGAKNVNEFVRRGGNVAGQVVNNEQVQQEVQRGNLIPMEGGRGGGV